jgi:hypothetical protein
MYSRFPLEFDLFLNGVVRSVAPTKPFNSQTGGLLGGAARSLKGNKQGAR